MGKGQPMYRMDALAQVLGVPPKAIYDWFRNSQRKYLIPGAKGEGEYFALWYMPLAAAVFILQGALPRAKRERVLELMDQLEFRKAQVELERHPTCGGPVYIVVHPKDHEPRWALEPEPGALNVDLRLIMRHLKKRFRQIVARRPDWVKFVNPYYDSYIKGTFIGR